MSNLWKPTLLTLCGLVVLVPPAAAQAPERGSRDVLTVYQFRADAVSKVGELIEARIEYQVSGRTLHTENFSFRLGADGKATFAVPDPSRVAGLARSSEAVRELWILVYVGDFLVDSFDQTSFLTYNERLWRTDAAALALLAKNGPRPGARQPTLASSRPADAPVASLAPKSIDPCQQACFQEYKNCIKAGYSGCQQSYDSCLTGCPNYDSDGDGVLNGNDNCVVTPNANQANCDGDAWGNVCDNLNANYQVIIPEKTCWTDKDTHVGYFTFEHHVEKKERDVSSCGAPDRWVGRVREDNDCINISDYNCCWGLRFSIQAVGDNPTYWCTTPVRDTNYCH